MRLIGSEFGRDYAAPLRSRLQSLRDEVGDEKEPVFIANWGQDLLIDVHRLLLQHSVYESSGSITQFERLEVWKVVSAVSEHKHFAGAGPILGTVVVKDLDVIVTELEKLKPFSSSTAIENTGPQDAAGGITQDALMVQQAASGQTPGLAEELQTQVEDACSQDPAAEVTSEASEVPLAASGQTHGWSGELQVEVEATCAESDFDRECADSERTPHIAPGTGEAVAVSKPSARKRTPDFSISELRIASYETLTVELCKIHTQRQQFNLDELKQRNKDFEIWKLLSPAEQLDLMTEDFRPKKVARNLVLQKFKLTSPDTLKLDRKKLKNQLK